MSSSQTCVGTATEASDLPAVPMRFEVTTLPVADVDRAKDFYLRLGWRLDVLTREVGDAGGGWAADRGVAAVMVVVV